MKLVILFFSLFFLFSCSNDKHVPAEGPWRAALLLDNEKELPFTLNFNADKTITIFNAEEKIEVTEIEIKGDSIIIYMPVFEAVLKGVFTENFISGTYSKPNLDRSIPFKMTQGREERFSVKKAPSQMLTGTWEVVFSPDSKTDSYIAKGIFNQIGHKVTGTFQTTTGDYRYLEGLVEKDSLKLSTFDGAHAFLFEAEVKDSVMNGMFYSGNHFKEPFTGKRNEIYQLPKADSLTFLKEGYEKIEFSFPNTEGKMISLNDEKFKNKVVIVQIMGSWCPNCLDETKYFTEYYKSKPADVEFVSLAFEYAPTKEKAIASVKRLQEKIGIPYDVLIAQYGSSDKTEANKKLPMLNHILSYPTTIFIDKTGKVRKIHTGFNGPATGQEYEIFKKEFESFIQLLASE